MSDNDRRARHPLRAALATHAAAAAKVAPAGAPDAAPEPPPAVQEAAAQTTAPAPRSVAVPSDSPELPTPPIRAPFASVDDDPHERTAAPAAATAEWVTEVKRARQSEEGPPAAAEPEPEAAEPQTAAAVTAIKAAASDKAPSVRPAGDAAAAMANERRPARRRRAAARDDRSPGGRALRAALAAYAREDYVDAARRFTRLARAEDIEAQYRLGLLYAQNKGVLGNISDAIVWYRRAAEQGHVEAQNQLSLTYFFGGHAHWDVGRWYDSAASASL